MMCVPRPLYRTGLWSGYIGKDSGQLKKERTDDACKGNTVFKDLPGDGVSVICHLAREKSLPMLQSSDSHLRTTLSW
jgi:hypothetical protein